MSGMYEVSVVEIKLRRFTVGGFTVGDARGGTV